MRLKSSIHPGHFGLVRGGMPMRRVRSRSAMSFDGHVGSRKTNGRPASFESLLERDLQTHLNADPEIDEYAVQPHRLLYWGPDEAGDLVKRSYTPDIVARTRSGRIVVMDAKARVFAKSEKWSCLEPHIRRAYEEDHGAQFYVLTEDELRAEPRLTNCEIMLRHRPLGDDAAADLIVRSIVHSAGGTTSIATVTGAAVAQGIDEDRSFSALMRMGLSGEIRFDHSQPLSPSAAFALGV